MPTDLTPELIRRILRLWEADPELRVFDPYGWLMVYTHPEWDWRPSNPKSDPELVRTIEDHEAAALIRCRLEDAADAWRPKYMPCVECFGQNDYEWHLTPVITGVAPTRLEALVALHEKRLGIGEEAGNGRR